jgi:hypothetical protein
VEFGHDMVDPLLEECPGGGKICGSWWHGKLCYGSHEKCVEERWMKEKEGQWWSVTRRADKKSWAASAMASKWRLTTHSTHIPSVFLCSLNTQHKHSIHFVRISKTHLPPPLFISLSHTRSLQPGITSSPYPASHSLVSVLLGSRGLRWYRWSSMGQYPSRSRLGKNRLFAVLSNSALHAAKASRTLCCPLLTKIF